MNFNLIRSCLFYLTWLGAVAFLVLVSLSQVAPPQLLGFAKPHAHVINFDSAVKITGLPVANGTKVRQGDVLLEVFDADLEIEIGRIELELSKMVAHQNLQASVARGAGMSGTIAEEIAKIRNHLKLLRAKKDRLTVRAPYAGEVMGLEAKLGQDLPAFHPVLRVVSSQHRQVQAFAIEGTMHAPSAHAQVELRSAEDPDRRAKGRVVAVSAQFVPLPERLKTDPLTQPWAREILSLIHI